MGSDPTLFADSTRVTTVTRSGEERALSKTEPSTTNDESSSVCAPALIVGSLALHEKPSAAAAESQDAPVSSDRAPSTQMVYLSDDSSAASAARCNQPMRSVPLIVSPADGGVTSGGAGAGVGLLQAIDSTSVRPEAAAKNACPP